MLLPGSKTSYRSHIELGPLPWAKGWHQAPVGYRVYSMQLLKEVSLRGKCPLCSGCGNKIQEVARPKQLLCLTVLEAGSLKSAGSGSREDSFLGL